MDASSIPYKIPAPFASGNLSNATVPIPTAAQPNGFASWNEGWGIINATNPSAGGIPPRWQDFLGIFYICSAWLQWVQAGGAPVAYDSAFQITIGGYPNGAVVASATYAGVYWVSTIDNNLSDPDTGGANWETFPQHGSLIFTASGTFTPPLPYFYAEGWGGGGGGGGATSNIAVGGTGGGGGGYFYGLFTCTPRSTFTITIGLGGTGGSAFGGNGANGTATSLGSLATATGGMGGVGNGSIPALGGNAVGGQIQCSGVDGGFSYSIGDGSYLGGIGGSSYKGPPPSPNNSAEGHPGNYPGVGGNGSSGNASGGGSPGGDGANGQINVWW